jgi:hypothetical protein
MSVCTIIAITAGTEASRTGRRATSARAIGSRLRAYRSMPAERSTPTGAQPCARTWSAWVPVPQPISRQTPPLPGPSSARSASRTPIGSAPDCAARNSDSYQSAMPS